jgi:hypothetical protein
MAGVICFTYLNNQPYFFMQEVQGQLEDFGGGKNFESETPYQNALREFVEETNGQFMLKYDDPFDEADMLMQLYLVRKLLVRGRYHLFLLYVPPAYLQLNSSQFGLIENTDKIPRVCKWYTLEEIKNKFSSGKVHGRLYGPFRAWLHRNF